MDQKLGKKDHHNSRKLKGIHMHKYMNQILVFGNQYSFLQLIHISMSKYSHQKMVQIHDNPKIGFHMNMSRMLGSNSVLLELYGLSLTHTNIRILLD